MIKNKLIGKIGCLLMLVWASVSLHAQSIELLGLYSNGSAGQLKAKVELAGKQIKSVTSYAYRMSDGFATTASDYELIEGSFLTADVEMQTGDYAYRMEVVLVREPSQYGSFHVVGRLSMDGGYHSRSWNIARCGPLLRYGPEFADKR